jgi:predicted transcriptional regulator
VGGAEYRRKHLKYNSINNAKRYFTLPNEIFCIGLSSGEIAVYSYLLRCENRKTYQCYPSYRTIGQALKMSQNTVRKYVQSLEEKHLIETEKTEVYTKEGQKRNGTLLYTIRPIAEAIDYFHSEQLRKNA